MGHVMPDSSSFFLVVFVWPDVRLFAEESISAAGLCRQKYGPHTPALFRHATFCIAHTAILAFNKRHVSLKGIHGISDSETTFPS